MPLGATCFLPQGQRGGYGTIRPMDAAIPYSPIFFVFRSLSLLFGFHNDDTEKSGETIATPPKGGFLPASIAALSGTPLSGPQGVAIVGIYPCGKARKRRPGAARIKRRMDLWNC